jgi:co-chaperonin GroES (HSP10)
MKFRPLSDWILVKFNPLQKRSSIIELVGEGESAVRTGVVLRTGPGRPMEKKSGVIPMDVKEGDHITFLRWHQEHRPGKANSEALKQMSTELGEDLTLIRQNDILFVYEGDVKVDLP